MVRSLKQNFKKLSSLQESHVYADLFSHMRMLIILFVLGIQLSVGFNYCSFIVIIQNEQLTVTEDLLSGARFFSSRNLFNWGLISFEQI